MSDIFNKSFLDQAGLAEYDRLIKEYIKRSKSDIWEQETLGDLKEYIDTQDEAYYDAIGSIEDLKITGLFPTKQPTGVSAVEAIAALGEGEAIVLDENQTIEADITINKSCFIDASNSTFTGTITIPEDVKVIFINATLVNPIVVA